MTTPCARWNCDPGKATPVVQRAEAGSSDSAPGAGTEDRTTNVRSRREEGVSYRREAGDLTIAAVERDANRDDAFNSARTVPSVRATPEVTVPLTRKCVGSAEWAIRVGAGH